MTVKELKTKLIGKINQLEDYELLEDMYRLLENEEANLNIYQLSEEQLRAVEEGQQQFKNGLILPEDQADKDIEKWLDK